VSEIIRNLTKNAENVQSAIRQVVAGLDEKRECNCDSALAHAILTDREHIPNAAKKRLAPIIGKYIS
jgi:5'-methylthioadenosine phosphorylase